MNRQILSVSGTAAATYILPVVFHIINPNPAGITDAQVLAALQNLNDAFAMTGAYSASAGADTKIQFCLAQKDPDGGSTTGITRTVSTRGVHLNPVIEDAKLKALNDWDPSRYINIWVVSGIDAENMPSFSCGVWTRLGEAGYATLPPGGGVTDGIVVAGIGPGPLLPHEMGHYLGLYHTFEGMNCVNNNCLTDGDKVCDTPPDATTASAPSCGSIQNSCTTDTLSGFTTDMPDMISNFMDYGNTGCHNAFTEGQAQRMRAAIATQRSGLLQDECTKPCGEPSVADFTRDKPNPLPGELVTFTNNATGATNFTWLVDNVPAGSSANFTYNFPAAGTYKVTLKAYNADPACFASYTDYVIVSCGVQARFYTDKRTIASKAGIYTDSIYFTNTSVNAVSYTWLMSFNGGPETIAATTPDFKYVFPNPGNYNVRLIATNGGCSDTTAIFSVPVADPTQDGAVYMYDVQCYQQTKVRVMLYVCNNGYAPIPANMPVSFYDGDPRTGAGNKLGATFYTPAAIPGRCCGFSYSFIVDVGAPGLNTLYAVFNDDGVSKPLKLPGTSMQETSYFNNIAITTGFRWRVSITPPSATLEPGDVLPLKGQAGPGVVSLWQWDTPQDLSCTGCSTPNFTAEYKVYTITKKLIATSQYGCVDSAFTVINIPPADDFTVTINALDCAGTDSLHAAFTLCNSFKRGIIPAGLKVSFYDADPSTPGAHLLGPMFITPSTVGTQCASFGHTVKRTATGKVYAVVNDNGTTLPLALPNDITFQEKLYTNNATSFVYIPFKVTPIPATATLEPWDTLQLSAQASPGVVVSYVWSNPDSLSCTACQGPKLIAGKKDMYKTVIAKNNYGCADTATAVIYVPPADDYVVTIDSMYCSAHDSLFTGFTICNRFRRGTVPKGLSISFYDADPAAGGAKLLGPVFVTPADFPAQCASYTWHIKGKSAGNVYVVVNDSGRGVPVKFPQDTLYLEKTYSNNITPYVYAPDTVVLAPADTTVFRKQSVNLLIGSTIYDAGSITWFPGSGYSLSCAHCATPAVTVTAPSLVTMQMANRYGCLINGRARIKIFPPDMTVKLLSTNCYTNSTTLVRFGICMNNAYDSVFDHLPVSFYDGDPAHGSVRRLSPVFYTEGIMPGGCDTFSTVIASPLVTGRLYAVVNDIGDSPSAIPHPFYAETDFTNNMDTLVVPPFTAIATPADTTVFRFNPVPLMGATSGGELRVGRWEPAQFLSCSHCTDPVLMPPYSVAYSFIIQNEHFCFDTAQVSVKTFAGGLVDIPNAFTPNNDGRNDVFYILGSRDIKELKEFAIFNRWGERMFHVANAPANDPLYGWRGRMADGREAANGVYVYIVTIEFVNGSRQVFKGTVNLVR